MKKEKQIETDIYNYLLWIWAVVEKMQWGKILIKKWKYQHMMTLQSKWACDIICFYKKHYVWIEVKKDLKEVNKWLKLKERYLQGETLPKSYERELKQIEYRQKILDNWWVFIITCDLQEIVDYFINL